MIYLKILLKKIQNLRSLLTQKKKYDLSPERDWRIVLVFFITVNLLIGIFGVYMFFEVRSGDFFRVSVEERQIGKTINREVMRETIDYYKTRKQRLTDLKVNGTAVVDPSI